MAKVKSAARRAGCRGALHASLAGDRVSTRGNGFRSGELEAMGSTYGTHCLGRARMEPIASRWVGRRSRSRSSAGQDKGPGPTSCTDLAVRPLLVGQDLARGPIRSKSGGERVLKNV